MKRYFALSVSIFFVSMIYFNLFSGVQKWLSNLSWLKPVVEKFEKHLTTQKGERLYVSLNQPLYVPGETVWFSVFLRNDVDLKASEISEILTIEIISPKGDILKNFKLITKDGVAKADFDLTEDLPGGIYTLRAYTQWQQNDPNFEPYQKTFQVQKVVMPRLRMKLNFPKRGYGPGEQVIADFEAQKLDNTPLANAPFEFQIKIEGKVIQTQKSQTDAKGKAQITFYLPKQLNSPDGTLNIKIPFEGQTEGIARSIPITLDWIDLKFYPEGGDLVAGLKNRVAFEALNFYGKGSDVKGQIIDNQGNVISNFESFHLGKGSFEFTPELNKSYKAKILEPKNISKEYSLPDISAKGFVMNVENKKTELIVTIQQNAGKKVGLVAQQRGKIYFSQEFPYQNKHIIKIPTQNIPAGVLHLTLFDENLIERCERLVFVNPHKKLNIKIQPEKNTYQPREKVTLNITTTDETGLGVPANLAISVIDDKILKMADDKQGHLLSALLLEQDVKGKIEEPNFYFDANEPKAEKALDLLLMTRGWRRFTWKQITGNPTLNHMAEKAEFSGQVVYKSKPQPGAKVVLTLTNGKTFSQNTDKDGRFLFKNIEFIDYVTLTAEFNNATEYEDLNSYVQGLTLELSDYNKGYKKNAHKLIFDGAVDEVEDGAEENGVEPEVMAAPNVRAELDNKIPARNLGKDEKPAEEIEIREGRFEGIDYFAIVKKESGKLVSDIPISYYRARQFPIIEYQTTQTELRTDFRNCIFWEGNLQTDNKGKATVNFYNNDAITTFAVVAEGISTTGLPGVQTAYYACQKPFSMDVKVPNIVSMGDLVEVPLTLKNNLDIPLTGNLAIETPKSWKLQSALNRMVIQN